MNRMINFNESNLSITVKVADLKALFFYWEDEWAKKLAEANKLKESGITAKRPQRFLRRVFQPSTDGNTLGI